MGFIWVPLFGGKIKSWFCFTVVYWVNMWKKRTANHLYKQLSTFKIAPQASLGFTDNNGDGRKDLWHHLMHLMCNCFYNISICKLFSIAMAAQVWGSVHRQMEWSQENGGYRTTSCLHCQRTFLTVSAEWPVALLHDGFFNQFWILLPQMHNIQVLGWHTTACKMINSFVGD